MLFNSHKSLCSCSFHWCWETALFYVVREYAGCCSTFPIFTETCFCPHMWSGLETVPWTKEKNVYSLVLIHLSVKCLFFRVNIMLIFVRFLWFMIQFTSSLGFLFFPLKKNCLLIYFYFLVCSKSVRIMESFSFEFNNFMFILACLCQWLDLLSLSFSFYSNTFVY